MYIGPMLCVGDNSAVCLVYFSLLFNDKYQNVMVVVLVVVA